jgi:Uma2 family endonuclease
MVAQHWSRPGSLQVVAFIGGSRQTWKPPGVTSTHCPLGQSLPDVQSPTDPIIPPPVPVVLLEEVVPVDVVLVALLDDVVVADVVVAVLLFALDEVVPAPPLPPVPEELAAPPQPSAKSAVIAKEKRRRTLTSGGGHRIPRRGRCGTSGERRIMEASERIRASEDEYIERERLAETKSELINGEIVAMAGGSPRHNALAARMGSLLDRGVSGRNPPCVVFNSDQKIHAEVTKLFTYPDVSVVCGPARYHHKFRDIIVNPKLIVEVLSDSTESYDRGTKFLHYQSIASLTDYVLVAQDERRVDHYRKLETGQWLLTVYKGDDAVLELPSLSCAIRLAELYVPVDHLDPDAA